MTNTPVKKTRMSGSRYRSPISPSLQVEDVEDEKQLVSNEMKKNFLYSFWAGLAIGFVTSLTAEDWKFIQTNCIFLPRIAAGVDWLGAFCIVAWSCYLYKKISYVLI